MLNRSAIGHPHLSIHLFLPSGLIGSELLVLRVGWCTWAWVQVLGDDLGQLGREGKGAQAQGMYLELVKDIHM